MSFVLEHSSNRLTSIITTWCVQGIKEREGEGEGRRERERERESLQGYLAGFGKLDKHFVLNLAEKKVSSVAHHHSHCLESPADHSRSSVVECVCVCVCVRVRMRVQHIYMYMAERTCTYAHILHSHFAYTCIYTCTCCIHFAVISHLTVPVTRTPTCCIS